MNKEDFEIEEFDYNTFKKEFNCGDIFGLEYLEKTLIRDYKDRINDNIEYYTYYDYIISLFYATLELNRCNDIYEHKASFNFGTWVDKETGVMSKIKNNFNCDLYFQTRDLLFKELGFNLDDLFN